MNGDSASLLVIVICIILSAYFSATETAFSSLNKIRLKTLADKGNSKAKLAYRLAENYDKLLSTILIGNNVVNIAVASVATVLFVNHFGSDLGPTLSTIVTTIIILIFGEISPKSIAKESPEKFALLSAPIIKLFIVLFTPFNFLFGQWKKLLSKIIKPDSQNGITEDELINIIEEAEQEGGINKQEESLMKSAIEFNDREAVDICTPKIHIVGVTCDMKKDEIIHKFSETGYSRLPVFSDDSEHIIGILYHKDFFNAIDTNANNTVRELMRPPVFITKNINIGVLLKKLQAEHSHIAIIIDEYGCITGLVTMEDILEELVGEIWDEHDTVIHEIERVAPTEYYILGSTNMDKVCDILDIEETEIDSQTASGWVMETLNKIPKEGDHFQYKNFKVTVSKMTNMRVDGITVQDNIPALP